MCIFRIGSPLSTFRLVLSFLVPAFALVVESNEGLHLYVAAPNDDIIKGLTIRLPSIHLSL